MAYGDLVSYPFPLRFLLISHTWDHYSSWIQHPTKILLSLISSLSLPPLSLPHPYALISLSPFFSLCLFSNLLCVFSHHHVLPALTGFLFLFPVHYVPFPIHYKNYCIRQIKHCTKCEFAVLSIFTSPGLSTGLVVWVCY